MAQHAVILDRARRPRIDEGQHGVGRAFSRRHMDLRGHRSGDVVARRASSGRSVVRPCVRRLAVARLGVLQLHRGDHRPPDPRPPSRPSRSRTARLGPGLSGRSAWRSSQSAGLSSTRRDTPPPAPTRTRSSAGRRTRSPASALSRVPKRTRAERARPYAKLDELIEASLLSGSHTVSRGHVALDGLGIVGARHPGRPTRHRSPRPAALVRGSQSRRGALSAGQPIGETLASVAALLRAAQGRVRLWHMRCTGGSHPPPMVHQWLAFHLTSTAPTYSASLTCAGTSSFSAHST